MTTATSILESIFPPPGLESIFLPPGKPVLTNNAFETLKNKITHIFLHQAAISIISRDELIEELRFFEINNPHDSSEISIERTIKINELRDNLLQTPTTPTTVPQNDHFIAG
ncbi:MAG: hypothetical protein HW387_949 [Parachlamydiales bacterium]|nr:hypothetical protein [Parachlamydiales bacterium]